MSAPGTVRIDVLGPLRAASADNVDVTPGGVLPRRLLALLVLRRGRAVSIDAVVEALWPTDRPAEPVAALQNHVSRLRRRLPSGAIESVGDGSRLDPAVIDLDADRLAAALSAPLSDATAGAEIDAALARWHGPAYPELDEVDEARTESQRLEDLRIRAHEVRAQRRLAAGDTDGLAAELRAVADEHPLREQPRRLLIDVLAATGRHADALRVFDDFRRLLGDELGIEPSPALIARHRELLAGGMGGDWSPPNRLPVPATSLIGRDEMAGELTALTESARLVTLVGPGGVGKTRLMLEVGHRLADARADRPVVLSELARADISSAADVVAAALHIDARPGTPWPERVAGVVADTEVVLLLDNCDHVLDPIAELVEHLLTHCPSVRVVATSRERLRVPGEQVRVVPPLSAGRASSPAVELFLDRAQAVAGDLALDAGALDRVTEIVRRLDGLPLAIELAAARMHSHDVDEIAAGLDRRFDFLSSGYRTSTRHSSLTAAVSWSFALLDDDLRRAFTDLSAFASSFDLDDAAAVCDLDDRVTADALLSQLVERSLVIRIPGSRRYSLLETLRAYGAEQLAADGRTDEVGERHAQHMVDWAERAGRRLSEPGSDVVKQIDDAIPELVRALWWLLGHQQIERAGRLVVSLFDYGFMRLRPDVLAWAERVTAADPDDQSPYASRLWATSAYAAWMAGDVAAAGKRAARALRVAERGDDPVPALVLASNAAFELFEGRLDPSARWYHRAAEAAAGPDPAFRLFALASEVMVRGYAGDPTAAPLAEALLREVGDAPTVYAAYAWYCAAEADLPVDPERARARFERALHLAEAGNAPFVTGVAGASKASLDVRLGNLSQAARDYRTLIRHWRRAGMWSTQWTMLRSIAVLLDQLGRHHHAAVIEGAIRATTAGHRVFGADEVTLGELADRLRRVLGDETLEAARRQGAALDGDALVRHALRSL